MRLMVFCKLRTLTYLLPFISGVLGTAALGASLPEDDHPLTVLLRRETTTLSTLDSLSRWIAANEDRLAQARYRHGQFRYQLQEAERRIAALIRRTTRRKAYLAQRLKSLYKLSRGGVIRLIIDAADNQDLSLRLSGAKRILARDRHELELYSRELAQLSHERTQLSHQQTEEQRLLAFLERQELKLAQARQQQVQILAKLQISRRARQHLTAKLTRYQRSLLERVNALNQRLQKAHGLNSKKGKLSPPTAGSYSRAAMTLLGGRDKVELLRQGLLCFPPGRSPVYAVASGTVRFAGSFPGFGLVVLLDHGRGYFSFYGYLSKITVRKGAQLQRRTHLGQTGRDPLSRRAALYFELRHRERVLDATRWLAYSAETDRERVRSERPAAYLR